MSWDVAIVKLAREYQRVSEIPKDEASLLGDPSDVQAAVSRTFEGTDWTNSMWGVWRSPSSSIEFNLGKTAPVNSMTLHVRGESAVVHLIIDLCRVNRWQGIDCSDTEFIDAKSNPEEGLNSWAALHERAMKDYEST